MRSVWIEIECVFLGIRLSVIWMDMVVLPVVYLLFWYFVLCSDLGFDCVLFFMSTFGVF